MITLEAINHVVNLIAFGVPAIFAGVAFIRLRELANDIKKLSERIELMKKSVSDTGLMVLGQHVQRSIEGLNTMKQDLAWLVENEHYEEAEGLRASIEEVERATNDLLEKYKKMAGDSVNVIKVDIKREHE